MRLCRRLQTAGPWYFLLAVLALLAAVVRTEAVGSCLTAICNAASTSLADFQAALPAPGNTNATVVVNIPSGNSAWTGGINYSIPSAVTNLTIKGQTVVNCTGSPGAANYNCSAVTDNTTIVDSYATNAQLLTIITNSAATLFRMTGLTVIGGPGGANKTNGVVRIEGSTQNLRLDHNHFDVTTYSPGFQANAIIRLDGGPLEGVLDHNYMVSGIAANADFTNAMQVYTSQFDSIGKADGSWATATTFGGPHAIFAESNHFVGGYNNDCNQGARYVNRYNISYSVGNGVQAHPTYTPGGRPRGCRSVEVYHNYYRGTPANYAGCCGMRGGTGLFWDNTLSNADCNGAGGCGYSVVLSLFTDRSTTAHNELPDPTANPQGWGYCGTAPAGNGLGAAWDGNIVPSNGYPCLDGVGRGFNVQALNGQDFKPFTSTGPLNSVTGTIAWPQQYLEPLYMWGTTNNGIPLVSIQDPVTQLNRDVFVDNLSFNGTTGVGVGSLPPTNSAAYPGAPNCTAGPGGTFFHSPTGSYGVGYFDTQTQALYVCTATNTWTQIYTPYQYPHPLVSGGGTPNVSLAPSSVAFGNVLVGSTSPNRTVTLTNTGSATLTITQPIALTGTNPADFNISNNCSNAVLAGGSCSIVVSCTPASAASFSANISVTDNAAGSPQTVPLTCTGTTAAAGISFAPTSITFPGQTVGTSSAPTAVTVTNTGGGNLVITAISISGGNASSFSQTNNCGTVAPLGTCTINVTFTPQVAGSLSSSVSVTDNAPGSPQSVPVSGTGNGVGVISFNPTSLAFGNATVGSPTSALSTTVKNTGAATLTLTSETLTGTNAGDFSISSNTCGSTLAVGASCVVSVTFTPGAAGARTANLTFTNSAPGSPQNVALTGTGTQAGIGFAPTSLAFGNQTVGVASSPLSTVLTNTGSTTLTLTSISITGTNASDFVQTNNCSISMAPAATCTITVTFTPSATQTRSANISFIDSAPGSPQTVPLSGFGIDNQVTLSPSSLTFPATTVGQSSATQTVTFSTVSAISLTSIAITGGNAGDFSQTNNCNISMPEGSGCQIVVTFKPTTTGPRSSTIVFMDTAPSSPQSVAISGTGTQSGAQITPSSFAFGNQPVTTTSSPAVITLRNNGTATLNISSISLAVTDTYFAISANTCGATLAIGASCTVSVTFTPQTPISVFATLTFTDDGPGSPQKVGFTGTGTFLAVNFNPASVTFANQAVSTTSPATVVTMSNSGNGAVTISSITITGTNASNFAQTNNCGTSLAGGGSCTFNIKFTPSATGSRTASLSVTDNAPGSPQTVSLQGTGFTPAPVVSLTRNTINFGDQTVGATGPSQVVILQNTGTASLTITSGTIGGTNPGDFGSSTTCGGTLSAGNSCSYSFTFTPTTTGARAATFSLVTNAASSPDTVALSGNGVAGPPKTPAPQMPFGVNTGGRDDAPIYCERRGNGLLRETVRQAGTAYLGRGQRPILLPALYGSGDRYLRSARGDFRASAPAGDRGIRATDPQYHRAPPPPRRHDGIRAPNESRFENTRHRVRYRSTNRALARRSNSRTGSAGAPAIGGT